MSFKPEMSLQMKERRLGFNEFTLYKLVVVVVGACNPFVRVAASLD